MSDADLACVGDACPRFDGGRVAAAPLLPTTLTTRRAAAVSVAPRGALEPARQYTWKVGAHVPISTLAPRPRRAVTGAASAAQKRGEPLLAMAISRQLLLPQALGLRHSGRWRWQLAPCALHLGADVALLPAGHPTALDAQHTLEVQPACRVRLAKRAAGCAATFHLLPRPALELSRPLLRPTAAAQRRLPATASRARRAWAAARRLAGRVALRAVLSAPEADTGIDLQRRVAHSGRSATANGHAATASAPRSPNLLWRPRLRFHVEWRAPGDDVRLGRTLGEWGGPTALAQPMASRDPAEVSAAATVAEPGAPARRTLAESAARGVMRLLAPVVLALSEARACGADSIALAEARGFMPFARGHARDDAGGGGGGAAERVAARLLPRALHVDFLRFGRTFEGGAFQGGEGIVAADASLGGIGGGSSGGGGMRHDLIAVVAGHWIDPWDQPGAPGERDFNLEVADRVERLLRQGGWRVLRPERDAPSLRWEDYLQWAGAQTRRGVPVLEVHGQGLIEGRLLQGVLGTLRSPLNKALAEEFGAFPMDWRELALPRKGGVILEAFNSDEVLQMGREERVLHADAVANKIVLAVERAALDKSCQTSFCETETNRTPEEKILKRGW